MAQGKGVWELCVDAAAAFNTVLTLLQETGKASNLAAVSKSFPAGIATPIAQSSSSKQGIFFFHFLKKISLL